MACEPKNNMPFTGRHGLISDVFGPKAGEAGDIRDLCATDAGLTLAPSDAGFVELGLFESSPISLEFPANEMIPTCNGTSPAGARIELEFRVRGEGAHWSGWFQCGLWSPEQRGGLKRKSIIYGELDVDHFKASRMFDTVQYRVRFSSADGLRTPILRRVSFCVSDTRTAGESGADVGPYVGRALDLGVPWLSQYDPKTVRDEEMIRCGVCAATSVTMALNYYGIPVEVADVARRAYDPNAKIYGNWSYLIAAASEFGPAAWVQRFNHLDGLTEMLDRGVPPIISIRYDKGDLSSKPDRESRGHLVLVRGVTSGGDLICNDPDAREPREQGRPVVYGREEIARAFFRRGGVALIIESRGTVARPVNRAG